MGIDIPNAIYNDAKDQGGKLFLTFEVSMKFYDAIQSVLGKSIAQYNRYVDLKLDYPHKPRSTGRNSQNNHAFGHARQIARETGDEVEWILFWIMVRAEKRGYPVKRDKNGNPHPLRWSKASVSNAIAVIDQAHQDAAELGIVLQEENW